jgi:hypothetical protein
LRCVSSSSTIARVRPCSAAQASDSSVRDRVAARAWSGPVGVAVRRHAPEPAIGIDQLQQRYFALEAVARDERVPVGGERRRSARRGRQTQQQFGRPRRLLREDAAQASGDRQRHVHLHRRVLGAVLGTIGGPEDLAKPRDTLFVRKPIP